MSNQAVPPCYLAKEGKRGRRGKGVGKAEGAACAAAGKTKLHVDFIVNCIKRLHIKNFIYHLGC